MNILLLGQHIGGSLSPFLHNHLFAQHRLPFRYSLFPATAAELPGALAMMKLGEYAGANVTSPHKELLFSMMNQRDPLAERARSVNTILIRDGKAIGYNTDVAGFRWALDSLSELPLFGNQHFTAAVLGTGGAARAAMHVLLSFPNLSRLTLCSRSQQRAAAESARWNDARVFPAEIGEPAAADILVNATPVGLHVNLASDLNSIANSLFTPDTAGLTHGFFYDMIYRPGITPLMTAANRAGIPATNGLRMFAGQAAESFRLWTGIAVDPAELHNLLQDHLKHQ